MDGEIELEDRGVRTSGRRGAKFGSAPLGRLEPVKEQLAVQVGRDGDDECVRKIDMRFLSVVVLDASSNSSSGRNQHGCGPGGMTSATACIPEFPVRRTS
ncbi:hypothetical protein GGTG_08856 [Gaeumannomyces tritici R3-111a-1]|uniref:Uncharacterized protein n=1 Tax=Gaeumannomyces tritici (strain R3-111a-1) TaxID=644352 RepID=J3P5R6_GAET3|nr:hypothetical protein GGTG_08856 [Gaeumannomyces tritici R3-111a-1]EJT75018.1 hypothetical protein GGTG_08856 [Gaeumannomyces tritici R3-111a-1]